VPEVGDASAPGSRVAFEPRDATSLSHALDVVLRDPRGAVRRLVPSASAGAAELL